jgi:hypothetical protein
MHQVLQSGESGKVTVFEPRMVDLVSLPARKPSGYLYRFTLSKSGERSTARLDDFLQVLK